MHPSCVVFASLAAGGLLLLAGPADAQKRTPGTAVTQTTPATQGPKAPNRRDHRGGSESGTSTSQGGVTGGKGVRVAPVRCGGRYPPCSSSTGNFGQWGWSDIRL